MPDNVQDQGIKQTPVQKVVSLREDGYYSNCTMLEATPFDVSILFGKVRPKADQDGRTVLVEIYEKQIYLSHLQAKALYEALGRSLGGIMQPRPPQGATP